MRSVESDCGLIWDGYEFERACGVLMAKAESGTAALEALTPEQRERVRAAVRLLIDHLQEQAALNGHSQTPKEAEGERVVEPQAVTRGR